MSCYPAGCACFIVAGIACTIIRRKRSFRRTNTINPTKAQLPPNEHHKSDESTAFAERVLQSDFGVVLALQTGNLRLA